MGSIKYILISSDQNELNNFILLSIIFSNNEDQILEAEDRYELADECAELFRESFNSAENSQFSGLSASNKTRWNSDAKMGKSCLKNKGASDPIMSVELDMVGYPFSLNNNFFEWLFCRCDQTLPRNRRRLRFNLK